MALKIIHVMASILRQYITAKVNRLKMTNQVCASLTAPDLNGLQNCTVWVDESGFLPAITQSQAEGISAALLGAMAVAFIYKLIAKTLN